MAFIVNCIGIESEPADTVNDVVQRRTFVVDSLLYDLVLQPVPTNLNLFALVVLASGSTINEDTIPLFFRRTFPQ